MNIPAPTPEQIAAIRRIQIGLVKIHEANQNINKLIEQHGLEALDIMKLSSHPQGCTMGATVEVMRRHEAAFLAQKVAA